MSGALLAWLGGAAAAGAAPLTIDEAVARALAASPEVSALAAVVAHQAERAAVAGRILPDNPELAVEVGRRDDGGERFTDWGVGLEQRVEVGGQRALREERAAAADAARAQLAEARAATAADARLAFGALVAADRRRTLAGEALALSRRALAAVEERNRAGDASLVDVNAARAELGRAVRDEIEATERARTSRDALAATVGLSSGAELAIVGELEAAAPPATRDVAELLARALASRPSLVAARAARASARARGRLAEREALPSPRLGVAYEREEEADVVRGQLAVDLPLFDRNDDERLAATSDLRAAEARVAVLEREVALEVTAAARRIEAAERAAAALGGEVIVALDRNASLVEEGYEAGRIDFLRLLAVRRELLEARIEHVETLEALHAARVALDRVLGLDPG